MNPQTVKRGIPGMTAAYVLAAGVTGFWCRDAGVFALVLMLLIATAFFSTLFATGVAE